MKAATSSATTKPTSSEVTPALNSVHISTGEKPNSEPTDRSNSPDVISSVMASAIRPSSTVKASVLLMFCGDRKSWIDRPEDDELDDQQHERPEFRPGDQALDERTVFHVGPAAWLDVGRSSASPGMRRFAASRIDRG